MNPHGRALRIRAFCSRAFARSRGGAYLRAFRVAGQQTRGEKFRYCKLPNVKAESQDANRRKKHARAQHADTCCHSQMELKLCQLRLDRHGRQRQRILHPTGRTNVIKVAHTQGTHLRVAPVRELRKRDVAVLVRVCNHQHMCSDEAWQDTGYRTSADEAVVGGGDGDLLRARVPEALLHVRVQREADLRNRADNK